MYEKKFSLWQKWPQRNDLSDPGVYVIVRSGQDIAGKRFKWSKKIIYVGMTNAGLKGRLKQFDNTIAGKKGHGGAERVRYKYPDYTKLVKKLYVSIAPFNLKQRNSPAGLRKMGDVARFEYLCLAEYVRRYRKLPKFNDKEKSPKQGNTKKTRS